jgi:[protein-PII] uridylyltransferase
MDARTPSTPLFEETWDESDLASTVRAYLERGRNLLRERHQAGAGGYEIVFSYTAMVDYLIRRLFDVASRDYVRRYPSLNPRCALLAQGGYGRGELNPHSDIDLLFLHTWKVTPYVESVAEKILYTLWDAGLQIGHAARNIPESIRLAGKDMRVKTALLDARYLCGDEALYADFKKAVENQLIHKNADRFVREKLEESRLRHESYGGSVYLLEPDIKEGAGGLRDIHTALWVAKVKQGVRDLSEMAAQGWIQESDLSDLRASRDFLWRVRNELHFTSGKHQDQLTFEEQEKISHALGFKGEGTLKGVEVFMRSYYLHASQVSRLTSLIIHRVTERAGKFNGKGRIVGREIREGVHISRKTLWISKPEFFTSQPGNLIGVFFDVQKYRAEISQEAQKLIRDHLYLVDEKFRRSAAANLPFFKILKWRGRVYEALSEMHRCGVLGAFIPEFGRLLCMVLHDLYHIYTVDQHSLHLIKEMERLKSGEFRETMPLLTQLAREVAKIEILYLGLLFHDIGKGYGGGHSEIGSRLVRNIARRMRLNVDDTAQLGFLIRHHLLMSHTAFRRDLDDEKTLIDFARTMGSVSNLKMLYLLTYVDIRAVGPTVWNHWKAMLLEELYLKTLEVLESLEKGEYQREDRRSKIRRVQARLRRRLSRKYGREELRRFLEFMPERYFLATPEDEIPSHFELLHKFSDQTFLSSVRHFPEKEYSEVSICAKDRPGLFACITGVFASMGLDILSARITTRKDGLILDVFRVWHAKRAEVVMDARKWARVRATMEGVLGGSIDIAQLVEKSAGPSIFRKRTPKVPTAVHIDNAASDDFTVVEVYTQDRIGVLFTITYALHRSGISIHLAKISTNVDQVADVFYVTDGEGKKIKDKETLERLRQILYQEVVPEDERETQSAH